MVGEKSRAYEIMQDLENRIYRPEGCYVIVDTQGRVLITQSPAEKTDSEWSLPQGGYEVGQDAEENLFSEAGEELGIQRNELTNIDTNFSRPFVQEFSAEKKAKEAAKGRPTQGKKYYPIFAIYTGNGQLQPSPDEIASYQFVDLHEAKELLVQNPRKGLNYFAILSEIK
jgi:8-oxo-dGTP pyrophosphatase MutT (NUDIX family)